ncbi:hypothetical protein [Streptomyces bacillaris]|uniref:hypothetical protein n=1 Tax=Streptomyces bacillaris TaxID=68179 RepID=UPI003460A463
MLSPEQIEQMHHQFGRARRGMDTVRRRTGRAATVAGTAAATAGLFTPAATGEALLATALATGAGLVILPTRQAIKAQRAAAQPVVTTETTKTKAKTKKAKAATEGAEAAAPKKERLSHQALTASVLYAVPGVGLMGVLVAEQIVTGFHWGEALAVAVWSAGTWWLRPALTARHMLVPPVPSAPQPGLAVVEATDEHPAAQWWLERVAIEGGAAPGTALEDIERTGRDAMRAVIRSVVPGEPVPEVSVRRLSALMDVPEEVITVGPVPGRGASVRLLTIGTADEALDAHTVWATRIAPVAMPGATITAINFGSMTTPANLTKETL